VSYDIYLEIDTGGPERATVFEVGNYTSNVWRMWELALGESLSDLHGRQAADCIALLEGAVAHMRDPANIATYEAMNPSNGWGRHSSATDYLARLLEGCKQHPKTTIYVSH
jgi:hypothetical protein